MIENNTGFCFIDYDETENFAWSVYCQDREKAVENYESFMKETYPLTHWFMEYGFLLYGR